MARVRYTDNPIVSGYPDYIFSGDVRKKCDTHFRVWLQIARAFDDSTLDPLEKALTAINLSGIEHTDTLKDLEGISLFLSCGEKSTQGDNKRLMDYDIDAGRIVASFQAVYNINITSRECSLHWWRFNDLLRNLPHDSALMQAVDVRTMKLPEGNDKNARERRETIVKAKRELAIPAKTAQEKLARDKEIWGD